MKASASAVAGKVRWNEFMILFSNMPLKHDYSYTVPRLFLHGTVTEITHLALEKSE